MLKQLVYLTGMAVLVYVAVIYDNEAMLLPVAFAGLLLLTERILLYYIRRKHQLSVAIPQSVIQQGEPLYAELSLRNEGRLHVKDVRVRLTVVCRGKRQRLKLFMQSQAGQTVTDRIRLACGACGRYDVTRAELDLYDPLHIFGVKKQIRLSGQIFVIPERVPVHIRTDEAVQWQTAENDRYDVKKGGSAADELYGFRTFQAGDKQNAVHWRLSAKRDELIVKEYAAPQAEEIVILLELAAKNERKTGGRREERILSAASGIAEALLREHIPHRIVWQSGKELVCIPVRAQEDIDTFFAEAFERKRVRHPSDLRHLYKAAYEEELCGREILLDQRGALSLNGEKLLELTGDDWRQRLEETELVL